MFIIYDILEALKLYYKGDCPSSYDAIDDFLEDILHDPKQVVDDFKKLIHDDALENSLCPICYSELKTKPRVANHLEYQGIPCNEYQYEKYCPSCGWTDEDD